MSLTTGWGWVLLASLALNLFIAGFLVSSSAFDAREPALTPAVTQGADGLVPPIVRRIVEDHQEMIMPASRALRSANREVSRSLKAEPSQSEVLAAAFENLRVRTQESQRSMHDAVLEASVAMSAEQRADLAEVILRGPGQLLRPQ